MLVTKDSTALHTTGQRLVAGVVYFLLFTLLVSSNLFVSKLHLEIGEPSPQTITAPWDMEIEDRQKYEKDVKNAEDAVPRMYRPSGDYIVSLTNDLGQAFLVLHDTVTLKQEDRTKIAKLKQNSLFAVLSDHTLSGLVKLSPEQLNADQAVANDLLSKYLTASRMDADWDAPILKERLKIEINKSTLSDDNVKEFMRAFVEEKVNRPPTLVEDVAMTQKLKVAARSSVPMEKYTYKAGQKIVGLGEIVDENVYNALKKYGFISARSPWKGVGGIALLVIIGMVAVLIYIYQYKRQFYESTSKLVLVGLTMVLVLAIGKGVIALNLGGPDFNRLNGFLIPVAWATMSMAILVDVDIAILGSVVLSVFVAVLVDPTLTTSTGIQVGLMALFGGLVGVHSVTHLSQRSDLARAGLFVAAANAITVSGIALTSQMGIITWAIGVLLGSINGISSSVFTIGTLHWFESWFKITSAVRLLELSNPNRPLLKRLLMEAPGTYHHSILVGNLAEAAAETVGADATLVRVGALYHDIGKLKRPYFFIENQFAHDNPHDKIAPTLSALIITSHVKDGLELGRENKLPQPILDIIAQHHGDSLVTFFYHKALEENEEVPEEAFRYDGPKPQTKEAALVALADSVEAAVRSMKQSTPGKIEGLVRKIIKDKLNEGLLDQSDLTLQDLDRIAIAFVRVLSGIFHSRVEYPDMPSRPATAQSQRVASMQDEQSTKDNNQCGIDDKNDTNDTNDKNDKNDTNAKNNTNDKNGNSGKSDKSNTNDKENDKCKAGDLGEALSKESPEGPDLDKSNITQDNS